MAEQPDQGKKPEGISVSELENFGKKHRFEIFFFVYFILATLFSPVFFSMMWSIYLAGIGAVLGIWFPDKVEGASRAVFAFIFKQEKATQLVLAAAGVLVSFFLAPLIFFTLGLMGGMGIHAQSGRVSDR
jgi:hypothetical protein